MVRFIFLFATGTGGGVRWVRNSAIGAAIGSAIGALLLSKKSELTIPVQQQEERTYEVLHCVYVINPQCTCARDYFSHPVCLCVYIHNFLHRATNTLRRPIDGICEAKESIRTWKFHKTASPRHVFTSQKCMLLMTEDILPLWVKVAHFYT